MAQKWSKIALQNKVNFLALANNPAVSSGGVSRGRVLGHGCAGLLSAKVKIFSVSCRQDLNFPAAI